MPTTASGGTSEIAIATPGTVSEMSERTRAKEPTGPVASAAIRSILAYPSGQHRAEPSFTKSVYA
jgi:hypothetical protein